MLFPVDVQRSYFRVRDRDFSSSFYFFEISRGFIFSNPIFWQSTSLGEAFDEVVGTDDVDDIDGVLVDVECLDIRDEIDVYDEVDIIGELGGR